jgi:hypothetical protein
MGAERVRVEPSLDAAPLDDQIDRLRGKRLVLGSRQDAAMTEVEAIIASL